MRALYWLPKIREDATEALARLQKLGVHVIYAAGHHRKISHT
jgi:hypothetical protein